MFDNMYIGIKSLSLSANKSIGNSALKHGGTVLDGPVSLPCIQRAERSEAWRYPFRASDWTQIGNRLAGQARTDRMGTGIETFAVTFNASC